MGVVCWCKSPKLTFCLLKLSLSHAQLSMCLGIIYNCHYCHFTTSKVVYLWWELNKIHSIILNTISTFAFVRSSLNWKCWSKESRVWTKFYAFWSTSIAECNQIPSLGALAEAGFCQCKPKTNEADPWHFYILKYISGSVDSWEESCFGNTRILSNGFIWNQQPYFEASCKTVHPIAKPKT